MDKKREHKPCKIPECKEQGRLRGRYCQKHAKIYSVIAYKKFIDKKRTKPLCKIYGCKSQGRFKGFCQRHLKAHNRKEHRELLESENEKAREDTYEKRVESLTWLCPFTNIAMCSCCGVAIVGFLQIHHLWGQDIEKRGTGYKTVALILRHKKVGSCPIDQFQVYCANCHNHTTLYGFCVHPKNSPIYRYYRNARNKGIHIKINTPVLMKTKQYPLRLRKQLR